MKSFDVTNENDNKNIVSTGDLNMSLSSQLLKDESKKIEKIERQDNIFMEKDTFVNNRTLQKIPTTLLWDDNILSAAL